MKRMNGSANDSKYNTQYTFGILEEFSSNISLSEYCPRSWNTILNNIYHVEYINIINVISKIFIAFFSVFLFVMFTLNGSYMKLLSGRKE